MSDAPRPCESYPDIVSFKYPLPHLAQALERQRKTRIVAIGSSSTAGEGDIVPYPFRLELALRKSNYGRIIDVLNRGIGGQEAPEELARFEPDLIGEAPALVIWQVGTNAVFHEGVYNPDDVEAAIRAGLDWLKPLPIDVVLMDLQYTTAVIVDDQCKLAKGAVKQGDKLRQAEDMVARIARAAGNAQVNVFRRFALMQRWCVLGGIPIDELIDPTDGSRLHMSEWATHCVSEALYGAIAAAARPVV
jgi:hypothetical protein